MSEQQLKDFGARAETLVEIPDFAALDQRGRNLRVRRRAGVAAALAAVLAVTGTVLWQTQRDSVDDGPVTPPHSQARPYPGLTMNDLAAGTYRIRPSLLESDLTATMTLPRGWNAWIGPNRFDGHAPGRTNGDALGHLTWYVGALVLEVDGVNTHGCGSPWNHLTTTDQVVARLSEAFATKVISGPEQTTRFGYPATRMRLRVTNAVDACNDDNTSVFHTTKNGFIGYAYSGTVMDIWVLDVDGTPIYVQEAWTPNAPENVRSELNAVVDSIKITSGQ
jgi:hypothetical protein